MATFTGYVAEVMEEKIRVTPKREAEPFDGIVFHVARPLLDETPLLVGQQVRVEHDERLTRSLPPQATAHRVDVL
ncbi:MULTISPECIES: hypothetical protein [Exiguobacterium]|uniref:Uncharacterized protein n=1 Tax=Exiguobacterium sp. (strain ATCC BAA-1283 / AT1b) TaxID=360911 RepID=C4L6Y9_EXISA|nr:MULTISPECIES: hypothetical protein [unclassified Exiguobacterium]ACQ70082.1 hypothetical protein EAT1b_1154 [Exiguobacterium sp. AT1b]QUP87730.1 hypothetical protein KD909_03065 [Exiguobacterium sp. PFWT01]